MRGAVVISGSRHAVRRLLQSDSFRSPPASAVEAGDGDLEDRERHLKGVVVQLRPRLHSEIGVARMDDGGVRPDIGTLSLRRDDGVAQPSPTPGGIYDVGPPHQCAPD